MHWLLTAHVRRYQRHYHTTGDVRQGRFKAFPIQDDDHLLVVLRYVERNPLHAGLVGRAEAWEGRGSWPNQHGTFPPRCSSATSVFAHSRYPVVSTCPPLAPIRLSSCPVLCSFLHSGLLRLRMVYAK